MKTITEKRIKILSVIENLDRSGLAEGEAEKNESELDGFYHFSDGEIKISYSEVGESGAVETLVSVGENCVTVRRSGAILSEFYFKEGESHASVYKIPPYSFDAVVTARKIRKSLDKDGGVLELFYNMSIGGACKSARMKIWICQASNQA